MIKVLKYTLLILLITGFFTCKNDDSDDNNNGNVQQDKEFDSTLTFKSLDTIMITADWYHLNKKADVFVLCHQAGSSRGEYIEIADSLRKLGYNCLAIDQRSGNSMNGVVNETAKRAQQAGLPTNYIDAEQDIVAAINFVNAYYNTKIHLLGSSYSSALALKIAMENNDVDQVYAFSPDEYLFGVNLKQTITGLDKPSFLTSAKNEASAVANLYDVITSSEKTHFIPNGNGIHGARALWKNQPDHKEYWKALIDFLN